MSLKSINRITYVLLLGLFAAVSMAKAAEQTIKLVERLDHHWQREFVSYPFTPEEGKCKLGSVQLSGPNGPLPVQLSNIKVWPDTDFVKSAGLSFVVDELAPLATNIYKVSYGTAEPRGQEQSPTLDIG